MTEFLTEYGIGVLAVVVFLESTGLPVPGESLVVAAGMLAGNGEISLWRVLFAAWAGSILGDNLGYVVGRRYGRAAVVRWGGRFGFGEDKLAMVEDRFRHYGFVIVLVARFVFILRQLNGFVAGMMRMAWPQFLLYNAISAALWSAAYGGGAYFFGKTLEHFLDEQSTLVVVLVAASVCAIGMVGTYKVLLGKGGQESDKPRRSKDDRTPNDAPAAKRR